MPTSVVSIFFNASLISAEFPKVYLREAKFIDADLSRAEFSDSYLTKADFCMADLPQAKFHNVYLRKAFFRKANLPQAEFHNSYLRKSDFSDADLSKKAEFSSSNLKETNFSRSEISGTQFVNVNLKQAEFPRANLEESAFVETNLREINLTEANLREAEFSDADLRNATFRPAFARTLTSEDDIPTDPLGASLEAADFTDGTDLRGANLSGARLYQVNFGDVRINNRTQFGIDEEAGGMREICRYEYDPNTGVYINEDMPHLRAAAWTYRRLESLFEEYAMNERARNAHIRRQEAQRAYQKERLKNSDRIEGSNFLSSLWLKSFGQYTVGTLNWNLHRHGESLQRLLGMSGLLIFLCGIVYSSAGIARSNPETTYRVTLTDLTNPGAMLVDLLNGWYFSVITFSTIGYGDFYPMSPLSRLLVGVESLTGALFIALFVFVLGRRVAR